MVTKLSNNMWLLYLLTSIYICTIRFQGKKISPAQRVINNLTFKYKTLTNKIHIPY